MSVIPIIGARRISQLQDNLESLTLDLSEKQGQRLNEAYENGLLGTVRACSSAVRAMAVTG